MIMYGINKPKPKPIPNLNDVLKLTSSRVFLSLSKVFHRIITVFLATKFLLKIEDRGNINFE